MTRRLLVGIAVVLVFGALLDAVYYGEDVGRRTIGDVDRARALAEVVDHPFVESVATPERLARRYGIPEGRFSIHLVVRDRAPGAVVVIDQGEPGRLVDSVQMRIIGGASIVTTADLTGLRVPSRPPDLAGAFRHGPWTLRVAPGEVPALLLFTDQAGFDLVDVRLLPERAVVTTLGPDLARTVLDGPGTLRGATDIALTRAIAVETLVLGVLLLAGGLLLPRTIRRSVRLPAALVVGVALHAASGPLLVPGRLGLALTLAIAGLVALTTSGCGTPVGWRRSDLPALATASAGITLLVTFVLVRRALFVTADSFAYWTGGAALADGVLGPAGVGIKRGMAQQALHAAGFAFGSQGLQSLGPVLLAAGTALLLAVAAGAEAGRSRARLVTGIAAVGALLASPQVQTMAVYLNGHVLVAVLLVTLILLLARATDDEARRAMLPAVAVVIAALVVTRVEGAVLAGLVLLGTLAARGVPTMWRGPWTVLGGSTIAWAGLVVLAGDASAVTVLLLVVGVAVLVFATFGPGLPRIHRSVPIGVGTVLWIATPVLLVQDRVRFLDAAVANLGVGEGRWGVLAPLLLLVAVLAVLHTAGSPDTAVQSARWLLIGFVPIALIAKLGDGLEADDTDLTRLLVGGGRVGWGDSVNRMWMHAALVTMLLLILAVQQRQERPQIARWRAPRIAGDVALLLLGVWIALQWQPGYVAVTAPPERLVVVDVPDDGREATVGELVDGSVVRQSLQGPSTPRSALPDTARITDVCARVLGVTFGRDLEGELQLELQRTDAVGAATYAASDIRDWEPLEVCLPVPADDPIEAWLAASPLELRVLATGAAPGSAPSITQVAEGPGFGATVTFGADESALSRRVGHLAVNVALVHERPLRWYERPVERSVRFLPWLVLALGAGSVAARWRA